MPLKGEAATNPFYILEKFSQALGARTQWNRGISLPPSNGVVFISELNWDLSVERRQRLEHWVESGGRLVVEGSLINSTDSFEKWSGVGEQKNQLLPKTKDGFVQPPEYCYTLEERGGAAQGSYSVCGLYVAHSLTSSRKADWDLHSQQLGLQTVRVRVGRGDVTVINGTPFADRELLAGTTGSCLQQRPNYGGVMRFTSFPNPIRPPCSSWPGSWDGRYSAWSASRWLSRSGAPAYALVRWPRPQRPPAVRLQSRFAARAIHDANR